MKLVVGLGNPGKKYACTRHNVGFLMANKLQKEWDFPEFEFSKKFNAEISQNKLEIGNWKLEIMLVKPQTFMNRSGEAAKKIMKFYKLKPVDLIVIHDDLDIDLGKHKISTDSSAAGHRGVESVISALGTKKFKRFRIGIEGTQLRQKRKISGDEFVLKNFPEKEIKVIKKILNEATCLIEKTL